MSDTQAILTQLKLAKGDLLRSGKAMTLRQFRGRIERYIESKWPRLDQLHRPADFAQWQTDLLPTLAEAQAAFEFNQQLEARNTAQERLSRYILSEGRAEVTEEVETGEFDPETGDPITETVIVLGAIDPLPATIEEPVLDPETGEPTGAMQTVPNPDIVQDEAERAEAQAVLDALPTEVMEWGNE